MNLLFLFTMAFAFSDTVYAETGHDLFKPEVTCSRIFSYHGKVLALDSGRKRDAEGLRPYLNGNSQAIELLNRYQSSLKAPPWPAYIGTFGIATMIGGNIAIEQFEETRKHRAYYRWGVIALGSGILLSSYFYGQRKMRNNERNLEDAISTYNNSAKPNDRLRVMLEPSEEGVGAQLRALFPF